MKRSEEGNMKGGVGMTKGIERRYQADYSGQ